MTVSIANRQRTKKINTRLLKQIAVALFSELEITEVELGISLLNATEMARVNWQFLQHEGSTDVITFDHGNSEFQIPNSELKVHGELFICVDDAISQAKQAYIVASDARYRSPLDTLCRAPAGCSLYPF